MAKSIVVTGANRGIGLELVKELLKREEVGQLFATTRNPATSDELRAVSDPRLVIVEMDVESDASVNKGVQQITQTLGSSGLDILINNAGIQIGVDYNKPINREDAARNFSVNCISVMVVTQAFHDLLKKAAAKHGHSLIVNIGSRLGSHSSKTGPGSMFYTGYAMSKAALNMFTTYVAIDWKPDGIRCVVLHPGWVRTDLGTQEADLSTEECSTSVIETIFKLKEEHNGKFYNWKFDPIPWQKH